MKRRRVVVTLELDTGEGLSALRSARWWNIALQLRLNPSRVLQAQANVIRKKRLKST